MSLLFSQRNERQQRPCQTVVRASLDDARWNKCQLDEKVEKLPLLAGCMLILSWDSFIRTSGNLVISARWTSARASGRVCSQLSCCSFVVTCLTRLSAWFIHPGVTTTAQHDDNTSDTKQVITSLLASKFTLYTKQAATQLPCRDENIERMRQSITNSKWNGEEERKKTKKDDGIGSRFVPGERLLTETRSFVRSFVPLFWTRSEKPSKNNKIWSLPSSLQVPPSKAK